MELVIGPGVKATEKKVRSSLLFADWMKRRDSNWKGTVTVNVADIWKTDRKIHALYLTVEEKGDPWPVQFILRTETVDVLTILTDGIERHIVFVAQYRPAISAFVMSNVAGGIEQGETVEGAAEREVRQEIGLEKSIKFSLERLQQKAVLASPGMINERTYLLKATIRVDTKRLAKLLKQLKGKRTGVKQEGEILKTCTRPDKRAMQFIESQPNPDAKTLLSLSLGL